MLIAQSQLDFFKSEDARHQLLNAAHQDAPSPGRGHSYEIDLDVYDKVIVAFSGGKDSVACLLHLLERGVDRSKIELHHHLVDGEDFDDKEGLMDWPCTDDYCRKVAMAFGLRYSTSFRVGGFEAELDRNEQPTAPVSIPYEVGGERLLIGGAGKPNTRLKFPQLSSNLAQRWCSSAVKISVMDAWLRNDPQFLTGKTLVVTGERAEESKARSTYPAFEAHRADNRTGPRVVRFIDHWRPVHQWSEQQVWEIIERFSLVAHPSYYLGWSRASCLPCIFGNKDQWATIRFIAPEKFKRIALKEQGTGLTINRKFSITEMADKGVPYPASADPYWTKVGFSKKFDIPIFAENWVLPAGAYGEGCGPI